MRKLNHNKVRHNELISALTSSIINTLFSHVDKVEIANECITSLFGENSEIILENNTLQLRIDLTKKNYDRFTELLVTKWVHFWTTNKQFKDLRHRTLFIKSEWLQKFLFLSELDSNSYQEQLFINNCFSMFQLTVEFTKKGSPYKIHIPKGNKSLPKLIKEFMDHKTLLGGLYLVEDLGITKLKRK